MTVRDSAAERSSGLGIVHSQSAAVLLPEELPHFAEQSIHVGACVIAGNIGVQVLPRSFDPVVVRTVRRQKRQSDPASEAGERHPRDPTVVNPVVVENHVNHCGLRTLRRELGQQGDEQRTGLTLAFDPNQRAGADVQRPRQITLDVLARRRDFLLLALHHPIRADLRIQVNVHLVLVERALVVRHRGQQATNFRQAPAFGDRRPRAAHRRPWSAPPRLDQCQGPAHGRHVNANARLAFHRLEQKFTRPGRTPPAVLLRRRPHQPIQHVEVVLVELGGAVVFAAIEEAAHAHGAEAIGHAIDRGVVDGEPARRLAGTPAAGEVEDDQVADTQLGRATGMQIFEEPLLDEITQFGDNRRHGNSLPWGVSPREHSHGEFPFSSRTTDPENCSNVQLNRARSFRSLVSTWRRRDGANSVVTNLLSRHCLSWCSRAPLLAVAVVFIGLLAPLHANSEERRTARFDDYGFSVSLYQNEDLAIRLDPGDLGSQAILAVRVGKEEIGEFEIGDDETLPTEHSIRGPVEEGYGKLAIWQRNGLRFERIVQRGPSGKYYQPRITVFFPADAHWRRYIVVWFTSNNQEMSRRLDRIVSTIKPLPSALKSWRDNSDRAQH